MKVDPTHANNWIGDYILIDGQVRFAANTTTTLTINQSVAGGALTGSWNLLASTGPARQGTWASVTNNVAGTITQWDPTNLDYQILK
jgi:hypothetical protein